MTDLAETRSSRTATWLPDAQRYRYKPDPTWRRLPAPRLTRVSTEYRFHGAPTHNARVTTASRTPS